MKYIVIILIVIIIIKLLSSSKNAKKDIMANDKNKGNTEIKNKKYIKPPLTLLNKSNIKSSLSQEEILNNTKKIENILKTFNIKAKVVQINHGASITMYELELSKSAKVNDILKIEKEIAFSLGLKKLRLLVPIPGKNTIGIEVPNKDINIIHLHEMLSSIPDDLKDNELLIPLGKDVFSNYKYINLKVEGHILVTGMYESGKTTFLNNVILSTIIRTNPLDIKLILIDYKITEFNIYNNIPHLHIPVISDRIKTITLFQKLVIEMENRYELMKKTQTKNIDEYNKNIGKQTNDPNNKLPKLLIIIDSYSDLSINNNEELEASIKQIIKEGKKAGIHLILSSDNSNVINRNMIKEYNFPVNIKFKSNNIDDKFLLGKGDMLLININDNNERIQSPYISYDEIKQITNFIKNNNQYTTDFKNIGNIKELSNDPLFKKVLEFAIEKGQISASIIQREFSIGYNRSTMIIDTLEKHGIISPANGSKPRKVLINSKNEIYK